jgi:5-methylcytosine-specific restriction endonuclease McrA
MPIIPDHIRKAVFNRDGWHCHYCDVRLCPLANPTVDHKVPVCRGGSDDVDNLVAACRWCNTAKADMPYALFVAIREEVGYGPGTREITTNVIALYQQRMKAPARPQWNAVLCGAG